MLSFPEPSHAGGLGDFHEKIGTLRRKGNGGQDSEGLGQLFVSASPSLTYLYSALADFAPSLEVDGKDVDASKLFGFCKQPSSFLLICSAKFLREKHKA